MSLRDQLIAKGLVSKKQARKATQELRKERKSKQGKRRRKKHVERETAAAEKVARETREAERRKARDEDASRREQHELVFRVRDLIRNNRIGGKGPVLFRFRMIGSTMVGTLKLPVALARDLRVGKAAIAGCRLGGEVEHHVVSVAAAEKLAEVSPESLVFFVRDLEHLGDPAQAFAERTWETELGPRRLRDEAELSRWRAREQQRDRARGPRDSET